MLSWRIARLVMTDNESERYSVPEQAVPNPEDDANMRLDMLGFEYKLSPFSFAFKDPTRQDHIYVSTKD